MNQASLLDLKIVIKGDADILNEIYDEAINDRSTIDSVLSAALKKHIAGSGVSGDFEIQFQWGEVHRAWQRGGLNAREWMETDVPPEDLKEPPASTPSEFAD